MNVSTRYEEVCGHRISGQVLLDIDNGEYSVSVSRIGGSVNSSMQTPPKHWTRDDARARMHSEFDDEVAWAQAHPLTFR